MVSWRLQKHQCSCGWDEWQTVLGSESFSFWMLTVRDIIVAPGYLEITANTLCCGCELRAFVVCICLSNKVLFLESPSLSARFGLVLNYVN